MKLVHLDTFFTMRAVTESCGSGTADATACVRMLQGEKKLSACFLQFT